MGSLADPTTSALALALRDRFKLTHCIETGTRNGLSTAWASHYFQLVDTIEIDVAVSDNALCAFEELSNVRWLVGDSRGVLPDLVAKLEHPALFWLDAHTNDDSPLLAELVAIFQSPLHHCILIDDAACFARPAPAGINEEAWPTVAMIAALVTDPYVMARVRDVIAIVPDSADDILVEFIDAEPSP